MGRCNVLPKNLHLLQRWASWRQQWGSCRDLKMQQAMLGMVSLKEWICSVGGRGCTIKKPCCWDVASIYQQQREQSFWNNYSTASASNLRSLDRTGFRKLNDITNCYIFNLAITDLLFIFFCIPFTIYMYTQGDWLFGTAFCKLNHFMSHVSLEINV